MGQFVGFVLAQREFVPVQPEVHVPLEAPVPPVPVPVARVLRRTEELDLHLFELAAPKREIAWIDLVAEGLADLSDAEGNTHAGGIADGLEVDENPLGRLRSQVRDAGSIPQGAHVGLEHEVEGAGRGQRTRLGSARRVGAFAQVHVVQRARDGDHAVPAAIPHHAPEALAVRGGKFRFRGRSGFSGHCEQWPVVRDTAVTVVPDTEDAELIGPKAVLRFPAVHHRIGEAAHVSAGFPDPGVHQDRAVQTHHVEGGGGPFGRHRVVVPAHHVFPPGVLDVALQFHAQRTVVPAAVEPAIDLAGRKNEAAPLGERNQLVHRDHRPSPIAAIGGKARKYSDSTTERGCANLGVCSPNAPK